MKMLEIRIDIIFLSKTEHKLYAKTITKKVFIL